MYQIRGKIMLYSLSTGSTFYGPGTCHTWSEGASLCRCTAAVKSNGTGMRSGQRQGVKLP